MRAGTIMKTEDNLMTTDFNVSTVFTVYTVFTNSANSPIV
jgi:hypothetical protein